MKTFIPLTLLLFLANVFANAQGIRGVVQDAKNTSIPFATVSLFNSKDSTLSGGTSTTIDGDFQMDIKETGTYYLEISYVGYQTTYSSTFHITSAKDTKDLGTITIFEKFEMLDAVVVEAMQATVVNKGDRLELNVANTLLASEQNAYEVVKEAPGVTVGHQGSLKLNGKEGVKVIIDGRDTYVKGDELQAFLEGIPAQSIDKLEVIHNPSAKYDAEGSAGIINICLKKNYKTGFNGMLYSNYTRSQINEYAIGANLNYLKGRWNTFANIHLDRGGRFREMTISREFYNDGNITSFYQSGEDVVRNYLPSIHTGFDYEINENQSLGLFANFSYNSSRQYWDTDSKLRDNFPSTDVDIISNNDFWSYSFDQKINLHYTALLDSNGSSLTANVDYVLLDNQSDSRFDNAYTYINDEHESSEVFTAYNPRSYEILAARLDFAKPLPSWKGNWEAGLKVSDVVSDNRLDFYRLIDEKEVSYPERDNYFTYNENIYAAYSNLSSQINDRWNIQLGLRGEYTNSKGFSKTIQQGVAQNYFNLFSSLFVTQKVNDHYQISYSYSKRINRPRYKHMNPYRFYIDPYTSVQGNPQMRPQYTDSYKITHSLFRKYNLVFGYDASVDYMGEIPVIDPKENTTVLSISNMDKFKNFSATLIAPVELNKFWTINNMITSAYQYFRVEIENETILNKQFFFNARSNHRIKLPDDFIAELNFEYRGPVAHGIYSIDGQWGLDAGVQRSFYKDKLNVSLNLRDVFRTRRISGSLGYGANNGTIDQYVFDQSINLSVKFNFSKGAQFKTGKKEVKLEELNRAGG